MKDLKGLKHPSDGDQETAGSEAHVASKVMTLKPGEPPLQTSPLSIDAEGRGGGAGGEGGEDTLPFHC